MTERAIPPNPPDFGILLRVMVWEIVCSKPWRITAPVVPAADTTLRRSVTLVPSLRVGFPGADGPGARVRTDGRDRCEGPVISSHNSGRATRGAFVTSALVDALAQGISRKSVNGNPAGTVRG